MEYIKNTPEIIEEAELTLAAIQATFSETDWETFAVISAETESEELPF